MPIDTSSVAARRWLKPAQAAAHTKISQSRLAKLRLFGGGPAFAKTGRTVLYEAADLDQWLAALKKRSTSDQSGSEEPL